jgi:hypothetical protein
MYENVQLQAEEDAIQGLQWRDCPPLYVQVSYMLDGMSQTQSLTTRLHRYGQECVN